MAVTAYWYTNGLKGFLDGTYKWKTTSGSTFKMALLTDAYTPNQDTHDFYDDLTGEVSSSGTNYSTGGATLTTYDPTVDTATNETRLDCADVQWTSATFTARYAVIYQSTGTAGTSALIAYIDFGENKTVASGTLSVTIAGTGLLKITAA